MKTYDRYFRVLAAETSHTAIWRLVPGVITAVAIFIAWGALLIWLAAFARGTGFPAEFRRLVGSGGDAPGVAVCILLLVAGLGFGGYLAARVWHGRTARSLFGPGARTLRDFVAAALITWGCVGFFAALPPWNFDTVVQNLPLTTWLAWAPVALFAILMQTGAEELFFRGYLQGQLAARFRSPLIWMVIPALAFGAAHFVPGMPTINIAIVVGYAVIFGFIAADLTARTGSLGSAWGFHFANNCMAVMVVANGASISGLGLFRSTLDFSQSAALSPWLILEFGVLIVIWWLIRRVATR